MPEPQRWLPYRSSASRVVSIEGKEGTSILTLHNQAWIVRWRNGGWVWNRPTLVTVTDQEGNEQTIPIVDVTRLVQWTFMGLTVLFLLMRLIRK